MTEVRKESLSALIDGEASEIEVHRLVREFRSDDALSASWAKYQHIRATVRAEAPLLRPEDHQSLFSRISEAIEAEDSHSLPDKPASSRNALLGSLALAASLVVAVFIGVQKPAEQTPAGLAANESDNPAISVQPVASFNEEQPMSELVELDEEKQRLLRNYLNQHDRMARMNDNRRLVNYQENTPK